MSYLELDEKEKVIIDKYKSFFDDLIYGNRFPTTEAQKHFLKVVYHESEASTIYELAYIKFIKTNSDDKNNNDFSIPEGEDNVPTEGWFPRSAYNKNSSSF
jgi:uncharacterized protein YifE (UPF0438 family)